MGQVEQRLVFVISARDENVSRVVKAVQAALQGAAKETQSSGAKMREAWGAAGQQVGASMEAVKRSIFSVQSAMVALGAGSALLGAAKKALEFQKGMAEVSTIVDDAATVMPRLTQSVRDTAIAFGQTQGSAVKAQYDIISSGFTNAADAAEVLKQSAKLAVAGAAEIAPTSALMVRTLKGFGLSAEEASHAGDVLFQTVKYGIATVPELAEHFAILGPQARLAGISLEETAATLAAVTAGGVPAAEAVTSLNRLFSGMAAPTSEAGEALKAAGIQITKIGEDGREQVLPLLDVIKQFRGLDLATIDKFFPNIRAVKALGVVTQNFSEFQHNYDLFTQRVSTDGTMDAAFAKMAEGPAFAVEQLKSAVSDLAIEFGTGFTGELAGVSKDVLGDMTALRASAKAFGQDVGTAIGGIVSFFKEWRGELLLLVEAWAAVKAVMTVTAIVQGIMGAVSAIRVAAAATLQWAAAATGLSASFLGPAGIVLAVGLLLAKPLGDWLGNAASGAEALSAELARVSANTAAAADEFERMFKAKTGMSSGDAAEKVAAGQGVLVESLRAVDRATGEEVDSAEELQAAQAALGVGTEVVSAKMIDVSAAAQQAASDYRAAGDGASGVSADLQKLAADTGVSAGVIARLPGAVRQAFFDASEEMKKSKADLDNFKFAAVEASKALQLALVSGQDTSGLEAQLTFLRGAVQSEEKRGEQIKTRQDGLTASVLGGVAAEQKALDDAAEAEKERLRQLDIRRKLSAQKGAADAKAAADKLAAAREKAAEGYFKDTHRETAVLAAGLKEKLDAVKAFAKDAGAAQARDDVMGSFGIDFSAAAQKQMEESVSAATDKLVADVGKAGAAADAALEDGMKLPRALPALGTAISAAVKEYRRLGRAAQDVADGTQRDLLAGLQEEAQGLIDSGRATVDQIADITKDPLNSGTWILSAMAAGESVSSMEERLGGFAATVADTRARVVDVGDQFVKFAVQADQDAGAAVRGLVSGLGDLSLRELLLVRSTLDVNDALQASALRLVDCKIEAAELAAQQAKLEGGARAYAAALAGSDFGVGSLRSLAGVLALVRARGVSALEDLRGKLSGIRDGALSAASAGDELAGAFSAASGRVADAGLFQLVRLRKEARAAAKELESAARAAADKAASSGLPADAAAAESLQGAADAAGKLGKDAGDAFLAKVTSAAGTVGRAFGDAALAAGKALYGLVKQIIVLASDPEALDTFINGVLKAIPEIVSALAGNIDVLVSSVVAAVPDIVQALVDAVPDIVDALVSGLPDMGESIIAAIPELVASLADGLVDLVEGLSAAIPDLVTGLVDALVSMMPQIGDAIRDILISSTSVLPDVVRGIMDLIVEGLPEIIRGLFEALPSMITSLFEGIDELVSGVVDLLVEALPKIITSIMEALPDIITGILEGVGQIVDTLLTELLPALPDIVIGIVRGILEALPEIVTALIEGVVNLIGDVVMSLIEGIIDLIPELTGFLLAELPSIVTSFVVELLTNIPMIVTELVVQLVETLIETMIPGSPFYRNLGKGLWESITKAFKDAWASITASFDGIIASIDSVIQWFSDMWESIKAWFEGVFGKTDAQKAKAADKKAAYRDWGDTSGNGKVSAGEWVGGVASDVASWAGGIFQHGGVVQPRSRIPVAQFGTVLPGLGNGPMPVLAHAGEGFLQKPAVRFAGGEAGVRALNHGIVPDALRRGRDSSAPPSSTVVFSGPVFAKDASRVVDDMTSRGVRTGTGRTSSLLRKKYGTMPGQRS